jgi:type I restriction enzyme R subunit
MRHLIDTYIQADEPRKISPFDDMGLLELIVKTGIANAIATQLGVHPDTVRRALATERFARPAVVRPSQCDPDTLLLY